MRVALTSIVLVLAVVIGLLFYSGAQAGEPQFALSLICDTKEQVAEVLTAPDINAALEAVNAKAGSAACAVLHSAFVPGPTVATVEMPAGLVEIHENVIIGLSLDGIIMTAVPPTVQYMPFWATPKPASLKV